MAEERKYAPRESHSSSVAEQKVSLLCNEQSTDMNAPRMTEDHTVVICEEVLKRREILLDMCSTRETEINRKRAEAWDEVHMATINRCQRNLRLEQIKRVWRHQKNRVRHILNVEKLGSDLEVTLDDVIAARKGFMTDYEIAIARAYLDIPPKSHSPCGRRLDDIDLSFRRRVATSPNLRIDDSVASVLDRIAVGCAVETQSQEAQNEVQLNARPEMKTDEARPMNESMQTCNNIVDIQRILNSMGPSPSAPDGSTVLKPEHNDSDESSYASVRVKAVKRKRCRRRMSLLEEQYEMIKAQRIAFEEQAQMYRSMRSFIEESTRTIRDISRQSRQDRSSVIDSSTSESNLEFGSGIQPTYHNDK